MIRPSLACLLTLTTALLSGCGDESPSDGAAGGGGEQATGGSTSGAGGNGAGGSASGGNENGSGGSAGEANGADSIPSGTFLADADGYVVFEAEAIAGESPPSPWTYGEEPHCVDDAGTQVCSGPLDGGGYYKFGGSSTCKNVSDTDVGVMSLNFQIVETGMYRMIWRNMRDHTGGCETDLNNDSFVTFPTATEEEGHRSPFKVYGGGHDEFNWSANQDNQNSPAGSFPSTNKKPVCVTFEAGTHEMRISGRSNNHTIDRIAFVPAPDLETCQAWATSQGLDDRPLTSQQP